MIKFQNEKNKKRMHDSTNRTQVGAANISEAGTRGDTGNALYQRIFSFFLIFLLFIFALSLQQKIFIYNTTPSYPLGLYKIFPTKEYKKGDLVIICGNTKKSFTINNHNFISKSDKYCSNGFEPLLKKIVGVAGDNVTVGDNVIINGVVQLKSKVYKKDSQGNILYPCYGNHTINQNEVWVMSDFNIKSFDSRYFCALQYNEIIGKAKYIFGL